LDSFLNNDNRPIGVFDSGLGGLTVLQNLIKDLPNENFIYLGDLINLPYGNKSSQGVLRCALDCATFLVSQNVKCIIIACNTASAVAYEKIKKIAPVPVFDVVTPCVNEVIKINKKKIAILGTQKTIDSNIYFSSIKKHIKTIQIYNIACPLFVPIVEEGLENTNISEAVVQYYLNDILNKGIEQLILGCTHYPILFSEFNKFFNNKVDILHSGPIISQKIKKYFRTKSSNKQSIRYYVTDLPKYFKKNGNKFLNQEIKKVEKITLGQNIS